MANFFDSMIKVSARAAEAGILAMDSAFRTMQSAVALVSRQNHNGAPVKPPVNGPETLDQATEELSNRLLRIALDLRLNPDSIADAGKELLHSFRSSFSGLDFGDPRFLAALPLQLPLSFATLLTQLSLRGLHTTSILGVERSATFAAYMADSFADIHVFTSLQYKQKIERLREVLERNPDDLQARLKLGQMYIKTGLYEQAVIELAEAGTSAPLRAQAMRDSPVANYRSGRFEEAAKSADAALCEDSSDLNARWWLWLASQKIGDYPLDVPTEHRMNLKAGLHRPKVQFEDVAARIGLDKTSGGRGTAIFDLDGDGYLDVVISSAHGGVSVYRNNRDGSFTDVSVGSGLDECVNSFSVAAGDYNNDGFVDLYITRLGFYVGDSVLYRNNGDGTFTDVTAEAGASCWGPSFSAQWVDYDCDGNLDLFVANNISGMFDRKNPNRLFHNNGDGTFTEVSEKAGLHTLSTTICGAWGDYNNDGYPDLFLSAGVGRSQLYRNNGDGTFTDVTAEAGIDAVCFGSVSYWLDYDNDGWLDLVQNVWSPGDDMIRTMMNGEGPPEGRPIRIYHNNRDGTFTLRDRELGLTGCFGTMSGNAGDFNNDGRVDFLLGNGDPHMDRIEPQIILEDDGSGQYRNVSFAAGLPIAGKGHGANLADLAGDGRLCLVLASGGAYPADLLTVSVFRPKTLPGNYLNVRLVGTKSNRDAVGARLRLEAGGRSQHKLVSGGSGFGYLPYEQHFGLGSCTKVDAIEILWPSGLKQRVANLPFNDTIRITEGRDGWEPVYRGTAS